MWTLEQVRQEYRRLDAMLGIDTSGVGLEFSKRMTRQYGVCTFYKNKPQTIRLAEFLRSEEQAFWDTARHEYAHAAAALLTGRRHGHDEVWRAVCRRMDEKIDRIASQAGEGLSPEDRETMYRALTLLCGNLERLCREERALARPHPPTKGE